MLTESVRQIALLLLEAALVSGFLLLIFRARARFGIAPLCVTLGAFQYLQTQLAAALYIEVWPGIFVSPGSTVLFTATLFATLLVYIRDDAAQARSLIVGIVFANLTVTLFVLLANLHIDSALALKTQELSSQFLAANARTLVIGTCLLCVDVILIILLYELFYRIFRTSVFARFVSAMICVVSLDTIVFVTANFFGDANYANLIVSGLAGKVSAAVFYAGVATVYLRTFPALDIEDHETPDDLTDVFHILTYRQRYELLQNELSRDGMTGLFNRSFFDENLPLELERAARLDHHLNLLMLDLDNFKTINDRFGHQVGDSVIQLFAKSMQDELREADIPCRYGGEEFVVIMPDSTAEGAMDAGRRLQRRFAEYYARANLPVPAATVTFTAGIASFPDEAIDMDDLVRIADERLYAGKQAGRNCIIDSNLAGVPVF